MKNNDSINKSRGGRLAAVLLGVLGTGSAESLTSRDIETQVLSALDSTVDPCGDFYQYACGGWIAKTPIPEDETSVMRSAALAEGAIRAQLAVLLQDAAANPGTDPDRLQAGNYFAACLDAVGRDAGQADPVTLAPLRPYLERIDAIQTTGDFLAVAGQLATLGVPAVFRLSVSPDVNAQDGIRRHIVWLDPADPGYYDGDMYRGTDGRNRRLRKYLVGLIAATLGKLGDTANADRRARDVVRLEALLVKYHPYFGRQPGAGVWPDYYLSFASSQDWAPYFRGAGDIHGDRLFFDHTFITALGNAIGKFSVDSLKSYLRWQVVRTYRNYLPRYYSQYPPPPKDLVGPSPAAFSPAWKQCVDRTAQVLPETVGKLWVGSRSADGLLNLTAALWDSIRGAFQAGLGHVAWLDKPSRTVVSAKAGQMNAQLGFPAPWISQAGTTMVRDQHLANTLAANSAEFRRRVERVDQPVDRTAWERESDGVTALDVNAMHHRLTNQIYIPLGIQQEPFSHPDYPAAMNYGGLGTVLGHELSHGFDNGGRYFDANGEMGNLLSRTAAKAFDQRTQCLVGQYGKYKVSPPTARLNGKATLTENIADNSGLGLAYSAFRAVTGTSSGLAGFSPEQLFFVAYAQLWCENVAPLRQFYLVSRTWANYAPNRFRVNGPLANSPEFAAAFQCPVGTPMNPRRKCGLW